jgi:hypothetical protein
MAKAAASKFVAKSGAGKRKGQEGASITPSSRSIFATAMRRSSPSHSASVANTIEPLASFTWIEYRRIFRICELKNEDPPESSVSACSGNVFNHGH